MLTFNTGNPIERLAIIRALPPEQRFKETLRESLRAHSEMLLDPAEVRVLRFVLGAVEEAIQESEGA